MPPTATVGSSIADKATVTGGFNPTGTVTFTLFDNPNASGTPLFTDTETLVGGMATSVGYIATAAGTDYWVAIYNGDANNNAVSSGAADEPVVITGATPAINTSQLPPTATVGSSIADKATVTGGDNPTGTVTFTLFDNPNASGTPLFTDTETLIGGMATSVGYTATATGTDYWVATYNGDANNSAVSSGTADEPVAITGATPAINTSQLPPAATVGSSIADKATVTGGDNPTGTVTFNLYNNPNGTGTPLFTDTEPLIGGMATSVGYTATATGTDYWVATYNGDAHNSAVSSGTADEPVVISPATPGINTTQIPPTATVGSSIADKATVTGGFNPTGTVTFTLFDNPNASGTPLFTDTETLVGGMATSVGYIATATGTDYWVATYNGDANNSAVSSGTADEPVVITSGTPDLLITKVADSGSVAAGSTIGFTITITNTGGGDATGVTLQDNLPPGGGGDVFWTIDTSNTGLGAGTNPASFLISGPKGSQELTLNGQPITLAAGASLKVHITSPTNAGDVSGGLVGVSAGVSSSVYLGAAGDYAVLYEGTGGHNLSITNVSIGGNVGVGGTGHVQFSGPGTITGRLNFAAANSGQFSNSNGSNVGPASVNYSAAVVTTALDTVNSLSSSLAGLGNPIAINGNQTINESAGQLDTVNGVTYRVFNVTSYSENDGKLVTIVGDGSGDPVVFNFGFNNNVNLGGDVALTGSGLSDDKVIWNFTSSNQNVSLNNNASSFPAVAFHGIILAPNDGISLVNANLSGRVFGGDSKDMQIVSGDTIHAPVLNTATVTASNVTFDSDDTASDSITITGSSFKPPLHMWAASAAAAQLPSIDTLGGVTAGLYRVAIDGFAPGSVGTAQEQARIADALTILNAELESLGVTMVEAPATDGSANVHLHLASTTPVGGLADGVLGVTIGDDITIVNAANYYLGSDPTGIRPGQYDFETLVVHELAHAVGLGEGVDASSAMYPYLALGTVRRDLSTAELTALGAVFVTPNAAPAPAAGAVSQDAGPMAVIASASAKPVTESGGPVATIASNSVAPAGEEGTSVETAQADGVGLFSVRITRPEIQDAATPFAPPQQPGAEMAVLAFQGMNLPAPNARQLMSSNLLENLADLPAMPDGQNPAGPAIVTDHAIGQSQVSQDVAKAFVGASDRSPPAAVDSAFAQMGNGATVSAGSGNDAIADVGGDSADGD
jgi:uncharacterized repeat protein (TIGR01451 family)